MRRSTRRDPVAKPVECSRCGMLVTFYKSQRTGKWYPTNVLSEAGQPVSARTWFHKCGEDGDAPRQQASADALAARQQGDAEREMLARLDATDPAKAAEVRAWLYGDAK